MTVIGKNFKSSTTVLEGAFNDSLPTTYISSTELMAQVPASLIAEPGSILFIPSPASSLNFGASLTIDAAQPGNTGFSVLNIPVQAHDFVWDANAQQFYVSIASKNVSNGDTIAMLNPANGQWGIAQNAGGEPDKLVLSGDGGFLYAGIDSTGSIERFTLSNLSPDINIPLGSAVNAGPYIAMDIEASPSNPHTIAVLRGSNSSQYDIGGVAVYDDSVARSETVPGSLVYYLVPNSNTLLGSIDRILWKSDGSTIYGSGSNGLDVLSVSGDGVQATGATAALNTVAHFDALTGDLYTFSGQIIDPATENILGAFPLDAVGRDFSVMVMTTDGTLNLAYFLGESDTSGGTQSYTLEAFDLTNFAYLGSIAVPNVMGTPVKLIRWGSNGLAFLTANLSGSSQQGQGIYLVSGSFVTSPGR